MMLYMKWVEFNVIEGDIYFIVRVRSDKSKGIELGSSFGYDERILIWSFVLKIIFNFNFSLEFLFFIIRFFFVGINL